MRQLSFQEREWLKQEIDHMTRERLSHDPPRADAELHRLRGDRRRRSRPVREGEAASSPRR